MVPVVAQQPLPNGPFGAEGARQMMRVAEFLNRLFGEVEAARQAGDCEVHKGKLGALSTNVNIWANENATAFPDEARARWRERLAEAKALPCPPGSASEKPASAPAIAPATAIAAAPPAPQQPPAPVEGESILDNLDETPRLPDRQTEPAADAASRFAAAGLAEAAFGNSDAQIFLDAARRALDGGNDLEAEARLNDARNAANNSLQPMSAVQRDEYQALRERLDNDRLGEAVFRVLSVQLALGRATLPQVGIGVRRDGAPGAAPEVAAGLTSRRVNTLGISAGFQTKLSADFDLRLGGSYYEGDARESFSSPATGAAQRVDTGIVYGRLSNGSSGIIAGGGGSGQGETEISSAYIYAEAMGYRVEVGTGEVRISTGLEYRHSDTTHDLSFESSVVSGGSTFNFAQTRDQELDEDFYGAFGALELEIPFSRTTDGGLTFSGRIQLGPYYRDSQFDGSEHDTANFGPVGNRDLTLEFNEDDTGWGLHLNAKAALELDIGNGVAFRLGGGVDRWSRVGAIVNPDSGDQVFFDGQTTRLETNNLTHVYADIGINFSF